MTIKLNNPNLTVESIQSVDFPSAGTGEFVGCSDISPIYITNKIALNASSSSSSVFSPSYLRINAFSACKMPDNTSLIAIASQDSNIINLPLSTDPYELARREATRINIISVPLGENYAACPKRAIVTSVNPTPTGDCQNGLVDISINVSDEVWSDENLQYIWILDGEFAGTKLAITDRMTPNIWRVLPVNITVKLPINTCFTYVAYGENASSYPNSLNTISPLPYIYVNGFAVSSVNPQISTNPCASPNQPPYVYMVAEASVNGAYQLFFCGFTVGSQYEVFGWQQLTFTGENKNARIKCDSAGNLHVTWESSRCNPSQIFYGIIGNSSREIINETFVSIVDKQIQQRTEGITSSLPSLVNIYPPTSIELRDVDEYGSPLEASAWNSYTINGGNCTITNEHSISVSGNPKTQKFAAFATLKHDEFGYYFDGDFSQLSYQISFNLNITSSETNSLLDIAEEFILFKQTFSNYPSYVNNTNIYVQNGHFYTIEDPLTVYENIIPIVGAYKNNGNQQIALKHFMLVASPEKVRFVAKSTQGLGDVYEEFYTGNFKLGLVFETSANISEQSLNYQKHHWIRLFGDPVSFNNLHSYKIAVHYSHLREEGVKNRDYNQTINLTEQNIRFSGDIIVTVDDVPQVAESFVPDFSDQYRQFDLGFGCATVGEFRTLSLNPYDGSTNDSLPVSMNFSSITVGPHSVIANPLISYFAPTDRYVEQMFVHSEVNELTSMSSPDEAWDTTDNYLLSLGLNRQKFALSQVPITLLGRNTAPSIALDNCNRPHLAYQSNRNGKWQIFYSSCIEAGIPFRFDTQITNTTGESLNPTLSIDNKGRRLIAWHDNRNGKFQIYAARSTDSIGCDEEICTRDRLSLLGLVPESSGFKDFEYDPYFDDTYSANICQIAFIFRNDETAAKYFHFRINVFTDSAFTSFLNDFDSRLDISNWYANGTQLAYNGIYITPGESVEIVYSPSKEDNLLGEVYYLEFEADDGNSIKPLKDTSIYFCPVEQGTRCTIPLVYSNTTLSSQTVHFQVRVFRDYEMTQMVLSSSTQTDITKWVSGQSSFPNGGISVSPGNMISVVYNPEFLSLAQSNQRDNSVVTALLCGATYWVITEAYTGEEYQTLETFALSCSCSDIQTHIWRKDTQSRGWICSGQGGQDTRLTLTSANALFPQSDASQDGIIYISWEDQRFSQGLNKYNNYVYYCIWDARKDEFYSSAQGFRDREVSTFNKYKPIVIVNNMQHVNFLFSDGNSIYLRTCSLYQSQLTSSSSSVGEQGVFNNNQLPQSQSDINNCVFVKVVKDDVVEYFHQDSQTPIALVDNYLINLEVVGPPGMYSIRFKNETDVNWSDWLNILPPLPSYPSSSSSGGYTDRDYLAGYLVGNDRAIVPWVLSSGSGNKTVYCQALTYSGTSLPFSVNILARYKELYHKIEFFRDSLCTVPASLFNGTPVVSTNAITISSDDVTSLVESESSNNTIYIKVSFTESDRLEALLDTLSMARFGGSKSLTFNVYTQGFNLFNLPLTDNSGGVYTGNFEINVDDGLYNLDGQAIVTVNLPLLSNSSTSSSSNICSNSIVTVSSILAMRVNDVLNSQVNLEKFKLKYNKEIMCNFTSNQCVYGYKNITESIEDLSSEMPFSYNCGVVNWSSPLLGEKGYFLPNGGENASDWIITSPSFQLDMSNSKIDYIQFDSTTELNGVLLLVRVGENVTTQFASNIITFNIPQGSIVFGATDGYYCHKSSQCNNGSVEKIFAVYGTEFGDIPAGSTATDGTGNVTNTFNIAPSTPWALGSNDGSLVSSSSSTYINILRANFNTSVSKNELTNRGFVTANGIFQFKFVHIPSGVGSVNIVNMTCGVSCLTSSSSSIS